MGNPIQDWLDRFVKSTKTSTTASGSAKVGTTTKKTASGKAGVGASRTTPVIQIQTNLEQQREAIRKKTHQELINAAYKVAEELNLKGGPWPLLRAAKWGHLTDNRGSLYKGPAIEELDKLTAEQKAALKRELGL